MELKDQFSSDFQTLNRVEPKDGPEPLKWQIRLFEQLCANDVRKVCDLPTGMGKTSIIHLWMLALRHQIAEKKPRLPTRLVYVVDRRTVVDQATDIAKRIKSNLPALGLPEDYLSVSTLRGQFADNREWTRDPAKPAIIIGTVDMIGSRLLFSGYRASYKQRPLHAGLLGQDTLLILDEAHLSRPFEKLIRTISDVQANQCLQIRIMSMSATTGDDDSSRFKLEDTDLKGDAKTNPIIERFQAKKRLVIEPPVDKKNIQREIVRTAGGLAQDNTRVVVFVQTPDAAEEIRNAIGKVLKRPECVEVLTGTMRGLERDELLKKPVLERFLDGNERSEDRSGKEPAILVSTSAGEVGFDLNADHMVCDAAPLDSMIQRLGRVNRRGYGDAKVHVFVAKPDEKVEEKKEKKAKSPVKKHSWESATAAALKCLEQLTKNEDGTFDASPRAIKGLREQLTREQLQDASSPKPDMVELTDILLDAWSMTSITARMPGRPPVAPWLRGLTDEEPQTTIAWRTELDIDGFDQLDSEDLDEWFDEHRVLPHETLSVPTRTAQEWIRDRWNHLKDGERVALANKSCIVDRAGLQVINIKTLVDELERKRMDSIISADIYLPASFGGIKRGVGLLDKKTPDLVETVDGSQSDSWKVSDVADADPDLPKRHRFLRTVEDGVEKEEPVGGDVPQDRSHFSRFTLDLPRDGDTIRQLVSLVSKWERPEFGTKKQSLKDHVSLVEKYAGEISEGVQLSGNIREALTLAAAWHDKGKARDIWQRAAGRNPDDKEPLGKSGGSLGRVARGYRHEFGSLHEFAEEHQGKIADDVYDLAMHLIATHHGRSRPHFPKGGFDPDAEAKSPQIAVEAIRRFARLQRRYGYWQLAWFENLLRCADAKASADKTSDDKDGQV